MSVHVKKGLGSNDECGHEISVVEQLWVENIKLFQVVAESSRQGQRLTLDLLQGGIIQKKDCIFC